MIAEESTAWPQVTRPPWIDGLGFAPRLGYRNRIGAPSPGRYGELLNTDSADYGGSNLGNLGAVESESLPWMGRPGSVVLTLPPLAAVVLELNGVGRE